MENPNENNLSQPTCCTQHLKNPRFILLVLAILSFTSIVIFSILRDRFVNPPQNQVMVAGRGKVAYQSDTAVATLGLQIDKAPTVDSALKQLNEKMGRIIAAEKALGIPEENITTQNYSLSPQYDYRDGTSFVSGYTANQQLSIKVEQILENGDLFEKAISAATASGANQVQGVRFETSRLDELKQQARILAIKDAKSKAGVMAEAAGVKLGKLTGWYENILQSPDLPDYQQGYGIGAGGATEMAAKAPAPQIPTGTQEIVIELNLNYEVK